MNGLKHLHFGRETMKCSDVAS